MKFCKDCKHYAYNDYSLGAIIPQCLLNVERDAVTSRPVQWGIDPWKFRAFPSPIENKCGPEGKHWEDNS